MTASEFVAACLERDIYPGIAAENEAVRRALIERDDARVLKLLDEEF